MNQQEQANLAFLMAALQGESMGFKNFNADMGNFAGNGIMNYNADLGNFNEDSILNIGGPVAAAWATNKVSNSNLSTFRVRIVYTPVAVIPAPVNIRLFASAYNTGVFSPAGDLVFTNAGGDTATISALSTGANSTSFQGLMNISNNEPFRIEFLRIRPKSESQLEFPIRAFRNSQFSSGDFNEISPDDYVTPNQFQLLRSDTPLGFTVGQRFGLDWTVDTDQTGKGIGLVMFISRVLDPAKSLDNKTPVRQYGPTTPFFTTGIPAHALQNLIQQKALQQVSK